MAVERVEHGAGGGAGRLAAVPVEPVGAVQVVGAWRAVLAGIEQGVDDPAAMVWLLRGLEDLKNAAAAAQARVTARFDLCRRAADGAVGVPLDRQGRGVAAEVGLARRESGHWAQRLVGLATVLVREMPHTLARVGDGSLSEHQAQQLVQCTAVLSLEHRVALDEVMCADPARLEGLGTGRLVQWAKALAYELDPHSIVHRMAKAESDRCVSLRPAPDGMARLSALLPVVQAVACLKHLTEAATAATACGDPRGRGQVMADTLVERVTGQSSAGAVPVGVHLVMTDTALLAGSDSTPARIVGHGSIPAEVARRIAQAAPAMASWVKRVYTGEPSLLATESRARCFPDGLAELIAVRDDRCRMPWCDAPIRHTDHVLPSDEGGATSLANGQGLCEAHNHAKQAPGWQQCPGGQPSSGGRPRSGERPRSEPVIVTTTPTGHRYRSRQPALLGSGARRGLAGGAAVRAPG